MSTSYDLRAFRPEEALNLITVAAAGSTGATTDAGCVRLDLLTTKPLVPGFTLHAKVTTNATAPGASKNLTLHYAFSPELITDLTATGAPLQFAGNGEATSVVTLRDAATAIHRQSTAVLETRARFLYVWYDISALAASAALAVQVDIVWLG